MSNSSKKIVPQLRKVVFFGSWYLGFVFDTTFGCQHHLAWFITYFIVSNFFPALFARLAKTGSSACIFFSVCETYTQLSPLQTDATLLTNSSQHIWMLHVAGDVASVCTPCCMVLRVVRSCCTAKFETGQTFSCVQTDATTLVMLGVVGSVCP